MTKSFGFQADEIQALKNQSNGLFKNMTSASYNALFDSTTLLFVGLSYVLTLYFGGLFVQGRKPDGWTNRNLYYLSQYARLALCYGLLV